MRSSTRLTDVGANSCAVQMESSFRSLSESSLNGVPDSDFSTSAGSHGGTDRAGWGKSLGL